MSFKLNEFTVQAPCEGREFLASLGARPAKIETSDDAGRLRRRLAQCRTWLNANPAAAPRARERVQCHANKLSDELCEWSDGVVF